jgi:hypothetical protein
LGHAYYLVWSLQPGRLNNPKGSVQTLAKWISKRLSESP